jgi:hypothetical protein
LSIPNEEDDVDANNVCGAIVVSSIPTPTKIANKTLIVIIVNLL